MWPLSMQGCAGCRGQCPSLGRAALWNPQNQGADTGERGRSEWEFVAFGTVAFSPWSCLILRANKGVWMVPRKPFIYLIKTIHFISWTAFLGHTRVSLPVVCVCWGTLGAVGDTGAAVAFLCNILIIPPDLFKKSEKQKNKIGSK